MPLKSERSPYDDDWTPMQRITKSELLGRNLWDLACALKDIPVWESVDVIELSVAQAVCLGLQPKLHMDVIPMAPVSSMLFTQLF